MRSIKTPLKKLYHIPHRGIVFAGFMVPSNHFLSKEDRDIFLARSNDERSNCYEARARILFTVIIRLIGVVPLLSAPR